MGVQARVDFHSRGACAGCVCCLVLFFPSGQQNLMTRRCCLFVVFSVVFRWWAGRASFPSPFETIGPIFLCSGRAAAERELFDCVC